MQVDVFKSGSDTTDLHIKCPCLVLGTNNDTGSINEPLTDYTQAKLVRAVLAGKAVGDGYENVGLSKENAVTVSGSGAATLDAAVWDSTTAPNTFIMPLHFDYNHNTVTVALVSTAPIDTGAITFEASIDDIHFVGLTGVDVGTGLAMRSPVVNIAGGTTKIFTFNVSGFNHFRYRLSTQIGQLSPPLPSGTVTSSYLLQGLSSPSVSTTITTGTINVDSNQGTPTTLGNAWPTELTDGTHGPAAVKGASTPAGVTDSALVVAISPNNSVAVTGTFFPATQPVSGTVAVTQSTSPWIVQDNRFVRTVAQDGSGNVGVNVENFPANQTVSGGVTAQILDSGGVNKATVDSDGQLFVGLPDVEFSLGITSPPTVPVSALLIGGQTADVSTTFAPLPLAVGGGSVVVSEPTLDSCISGSKLAVKATDGDVFVRQTTATNLKTQANTYDGAGNAVTSNSTTFSGKVGLDVNVLGTLGTAFSTAGKVDVKGADGDIFVRQTAAANLLATVNNRDGAGNALTSNSTTVTAKFALDQNIISILGTAPTTAGFLDIKGADGNVFVRQATASQLNATVVGTLTHNNAAPTTTNIGVLPALANAVMPTMTEGDQVLLSTDINGYLRTTSRPAAPTTAKYSHAIITVSAATGTQTLIAAVGGQTIRIMKIQFTTDKATDFSFLDSTPTTLSGTYKLTGNGSSFSDFGSGEPLWIGAVGKSFQLSLTGTVTLGGDVWFTQT